VHPFELVRSMVLLPAFGIASFGAGVLLPSIQIIDLTDSKIRIKDLEVFWHDAEPALKPRLPTAWHAALEAIDYVQSALRVAECR